MSKSDLPVVVAVHRINGDEHLPGDIFVCPTQEYHDDLIRLEAIRLATDEEIAVHEGLEKAGAKTPSARGRGRRTAAQAASDAAEHAEDAAEAAHEAAEDAAEAAAAAEGGDAADNLVG